MEQAPERLPSAESSEARPDAFRTLSARVRSFTERLAHTRESGKDLPPKSRERVMRSAERARRVSRTAAMLFALTMALSLPKEGEGQIIETKGPDGTVAYQHPDERTDAIMRFLTGEGKLSPDDRIFFYQQAIRERFEKYDAVVYGFKPLPEDLNSLSEAELLQILEHRLEEEDEMHNPEHNPGARWGTWLPPKERAAFIFENAIETPLLQRDKEFAALIWQLQQKVGSPRIRWAAEGQDGIGQLMAITAGHGRAFYNPLTNTIYLTPGEPSHVLVAEDAHTYQFNERPVAAYSMLLGDWAHTIARAVTKSEDLRTAQRARYDMPGSLEHDAHEVIEPKLRDEVISKAQRLEE